MSRRAVVARHWVYHLIGSSGELLYVGVTRAPMQRLKDHARSKSWWAEVRVVRWFCLGVCTGIHAFNEEERQIRSLKPLRNRNPGRPSLSLKKRRLDVWLTQEELAKRAGCSLSTVRSVERGNEVGHGVVENMIIAIKEVENQRGSRTI